METFEISSIKRGFWKRASYISFSSSDKDEEIFSSDDEKYGGKGIKNNKVRALSGKMHGKAQYIKLNIPAFSTTYFYKNNKP